MTNVNVFWRPAALGALLVLGGCASYQASSAPAAAPVPPAVENGESESTAPPQEALKPRIGVHKPSDDTPINSGAGDAERMQK